MAKRKQYRDETGKKNPRPNRSTEYFNISDSNDETPAVSHTASSSQFFSQFLEEPPVIESSQHFSQVFFSCGFSSADTCKTTMANNVLAAAGNVIDVSGDDEITTVGYARHAEGSPHGESCSPRRAGCPLHVCTSPGCQYLYINWYHGSSLGSWAFLGTPAG